MNSQALAFIVLKHIATSVQAQNQSAANPLPREQSARILSFEEDEEEVAMMAALHEELGENEDDFMFLNLLLVLIQVYALEADDTFVFSRNRHEFYQSPPKRCV